MKTISYLFLGILFGLSTISCSSDDDSTDDSGGGTGTTTIVIEGTWKVTNFQEDNSNQTNHFNGYTFVFAEDGVLTATNGSTVKVGFWNNGNDDSSNKLNIGFSDDDGPFEEISEDWVITNKTATKLELQHTSGGDGSVDYLTFEKN
ncbi:MAG: hypothetical protein ACK5IC_04080 [Moheibacter sp.]